MPDEVRNKRDHEPTPEIPTNSGVKVIGIAVICLVLGFFTLELLITTHLGELAEDLLEDYLPWFVTGAALTVGIAILLVCRLRQKKRGQSPFIS